MTSFAVDDTTSGSGWNVTVAGNTNTGNSAVFKWYCPNHHLRHRQRAVSED